MNPAYEMVFIERAILSESQVAISALAEVTLSLICASTPIRHWKGYVTDDASATQNPTTNERNIYCRIQRG